MSANGTYCDWIAVDWGTSALRCWAMRGDRPVDDARSDKGMGTLEHDQFEAALLDLVDPWLGAGITPVFACGMVGARHGWTEAPYRAVPCAPLDADGTGVKSLDTRLSITIVPGLKQTAPADVMRGEETQIAGFLAGSPGFDGVLCLPGTHTKWAEISAGEVVSFRTFMSGEIFALLRGASVLRHTMSDAWDDAAYAEAVSDMLSRPEGLAAKLFGVRAENLLENLGTGKATARVSGLLIGAELAASRPYWLGREVVVVGAAALSARYAHALEAQGVSTRLEDGDALTRSGLATARRLKMAAQR